MFFWLQCLLFSTGMEWPAVTFIGDLFSWLCIPFVQHGSFLAATILKVSVLVGLLLLFFICLAVAVGFCQGVFAILRQQFYIRELACVCEKG